MEMLATARHFTAQEALQAGFVNRIVPALNLEAEIRSLAAMTAGLAPLSVAAAKLASRAAMNPALREEAQRAIDICFDSDDFKEGRAAFRERRVPAFTGK